MSSAERGGLQLRIVDGGLAARLAVVPPGTTLDGVLACVRAASIGMEVVKREAVRAAVEAAARSGRPMVDVLVAEGVRPRAPRPTRVEWRAPDGLLAPPDLRPLATALQAGFAEEARRLARGLSGWLVRRGERLGRRVVDEGEPGVDLWGRLIEPPRTQFPDDRLGPGVAIAEHGASVVAAAFGYAGLLDGRLSVLSPIWVAGDALEAGLLRVQWLPGSNLPSPADLHEALAGRGVCAGLEDAALEGAATAGAGDPLLVLARAIPPAPPAIPEPSFTFDPDFVAGTEREDGTTDFKERNLFPAVEEGALLAEWRPPDRATDGVTVLGEPIPAPDPALAELVPLENVRLERAGEVQRLFAVVGGGASVQRTVRRGVPTWKVAVRPVAKIAGDVGYQTGNLDFNGNVEIRGRICSGFEVRATGDVKVRGPVEAGARVRAGGDVVLRQSVVGTETLVESGGSVTARFIQEATVVARGDVRVRSYVHDARITSGGRVQVRGQGGKHGGIAGGEVFAARGIETRHLGSQWNAHTLVVTGRDEALEQALAAAQVEAAEVGARLRAALDGLGLTTLEEHAVRALVTDVPAERRTLLESLKHIRGLARREEVVRARLEALRYDQDVLAVEASVHVGGKLYGGVTIQIGPERVQMPMDVERQVFYVEPDGDRFRLRWGPRKPYVRLPDRRPGGPRASRLSPARRGLRRTDETPGGVT